MHEILATAMVLGARKDRGGQILPNFMFRIQKWHISGTKTLFLMTLIIKPKNLLTY